MPVSAMCRGSCQISNCLDDFSAFTILSLSHSFEVPRIDAASISTHMINYEPFWYRAVMLLVTETMGFHEAADKPKVPIPPTVEGTRPNNAVADIDCILPESIQCLLSCFEHAFLPVDCLEQL